jgi:hypothetical protein
LGTCQGVNPGLILGDTSFFFQVVAILGWINGSSSMGMFRKTFQDAESVEVSYTSGLFDPSAFMYDLQRQKPLLRASLHQVQSNPCKSVSLTYPVLSTLSRLSDARLNLLDALTPLCTADPNPHHTITIQVSWSFQDSSYIHNDPG